MIQNYVRAFLYLGYASVVLVWFLTTVYYTVRLSVSDIVFPLWRREGKFSAPAYWVWIIVPSSLFLMFLLPLFPSPVTESIAGQAMFWTTIFGAIVTVFTNYYYERKLETNGAAPGLMDAVRQRITPHEHRSLPGRPGNPGVVSEHPELPDE